MTDDLRLIEDYLPIEAISVEASGEPRTKGHLSTLHVWRARRPLVACRAAIYASLVPADRWVSEVILKNPPADAAKVEARKNGSKRGLNRKAAGEFVASLCKYPGTPRIIQIAQQHILDAHAARLTRDSTTGRSVTPKDISQGRAARPRVLDMFAGGGAIPLEALRLGCETYALDLNPVAYLIELCTVAFPQQFGSELADDVERWGRKVLDSTAREVADLFPRIGRGSHKAKPDRQYRLGGGDETISDDLSVVAYYWTRTVPCPNALCHATVPLYRQTWLRKKDSGFVALKPEPDPKHKVVRFRVVEAANEHDMHFDPGEGSESSATVCPFCQAAVPGPYVRGYGDTQGFGQQLMCVIALNPDGPGKLYLADESLADGEVERQALAEGRAKAIEQELGSSSLDESIQPTGNAGLDTGNSYLYGIRTFRQMFTPRQRCTLLVMAREIHRAHEQMLHDGVDPERAKAVTTYLGVWLSRLTDRFNTLARWHNARETIESLTSMKRFAMMWDYPEVNIFGGSTGDAWGNLEFITAVIRQEGESRNPAKCYRGSATELPFDAGYFDAVITDPPYYNNESYSELSDVCYVWLRPTIGFLYPEHFASGLTPKRKECVAAAYRQGGKAAARGFYEDCLFQSLKEAHRVIKDGGVLVMVYAHKTTLGWSTLVDAIRRAGFEVSEAWPLDTETKARVAHRGDAALATSIFLAARKRAVTVEVGSYEDSVQPELQRIVRERVDSLWDMDITGADLVISAVGAGLRAFTRYHQVDYANGEEVPAEKFLAEVEGVVLDTMMVKLSGVTGGNVAAVDPASRFYVLWRFIYKTAEIDAGEAIVFTYSQHIELDGQQGLSAGNDALVEKKKAKYRARDFTERGNHDKLGLPSENGQPAPLIDALHRILWLMENSPRRLGEFLAEARPDLERLRVLAQALAGAALSGKSEADTDKLVSTTTAEQAALGKLLANWRAVIEIGQAAATVGKTAAKQTKQERFDFR